MNTINFSDLTFDNVLSRFRGLPPPSQPSPSLNSPTSDFCSSQMHGAHPYSDAPSAKIQSKLDPSSFLSYPRGTVCDSPTISDTYAPRTYTLDLSPTSSASSDLDSGSSQGSLPKSSHAAFFATQSRVVRLYNLPAMAESFLFGVFLPHNASEHHPPIPVPATMWELREEYGAPRRDSVWAVFRTHEEACAALSLSGRAMSVATALESDLEPFHKLQRFVLRNPTSSSLAPILPAPCNTLNIPSPSMLRTSSSFSDLHSLRSTMSETNYNSAGEYTLSSNPPNPKTSFRLGDWIHSESDVSLCSSRCNSPNCAAHNFGRNLACIGCGCPRSATGNGHTTIQHPSPNPSTSRALPSPRFNSLSNNVTYYSSAPPSQPPQQLHAPSQHSSIGHPQLPPLSPYRSSSPLPHAANPPKSSHPLLTPSGRAFAVGGKVQNISSDPLSPCIMYWPDNEKFPEQGQIRPSGLVGVAPPILNTGNRGPISHQPGDWICQKCNYLNWRRRKVCQTCLPYAEGNGDSISAAVQAERIALLTSVLSQTQLSGGNTLNIPSATQAPRSHSMTPPQMRRPFIDISPPQNRPVHRSQSHFSLGQQYASQGPQYTASSPIYQTSGHRQPSPLYSTGPDMNRVNNMNNNYLSNSNSRYPNVQAPAPLLPSFLQDMVQSPALSPTSTTTSSADLSSIEEYEDITSPRSMFPRARGDSGSSDVSNPIANIWRLDGEESKSLSAFPLPNHQELVGARKNSREPLRIQVTMT
ncbi:hypothetical protein B0H34DRAFT_676941 [Crassisporium funariophilum]|nr:hypothetical protein B0H34DRAFT_676941 [Crassisporium funariophilum]